MGNFWFSSPSFKYDSFKLKFFDDDIGIISSILVDHHRVYTKPKSIFRVFQNPGVGMLYLKNVPTIILQKHMLKFQNQLSKILLSKNISKIQVYRGTFPGTIRVDYSEHTIDFIKDIPNYIESQLFI